MDLCGVADTNISKTRLPQGAKVAPCSFTVLLDIVSALAERAVYAAFGLIARAPSLLIDGLGKEPDRRGGSLRMWSSMVLKLLKRETK